MIKCQRYRLESFWIIFSSFYIQKWNIKHITSSTASSCWEFNHSSMKKLFLLSSECISLSYITSLAFHIIVVFTFLRHLKFLVCEYFNDVVSSVKWKRTPGIINVCPKSRLGWYVYVNHQRLLYNLRIYLHACIVFVFVVVVNNRCCCCFAFVCVFSIIIRIELCV